MKISLVLSIAMLPLIGCSRFEEIHFKKKQSISCEMNYNKTNFNWINTKNQVVFISTDRQDQAISMLGNRKIREISYKTITIFIPNLDIPKNNRAYLVKIDFLSPRTRNIDQIPYVNLKLSMDSTKTAHIMSYVLGDYAHTTTVAALIYGPDIVLDVKTECGAAI